MPEFTCFAYKQKNGCFFFPMPSPEAKWIRGFLCLLSAMTVQYLGWRTLNDRPLPGVHLDHLFSSDFPHKWGFPWVLQPQGLRQPWISTLEGSQGGLVCTDAIDEQKLQFRGTNDSPTVAQLIEQGLKPRSLTPSAVHVLSLRMSLPGTAHFIPASLMWHNSFSDSQFLAEAGQFLRGELHKWPTFSKWRRTSGSSFPSGMEMELTFLWA